MTTNTTLPADMRAKYRLIRALKGGPVYAFPQYGGWKVDFSALTGRQAERLIAAGWPHLVRVETSSPPAEGKPAGRVARKSLETTEPSDTQEQE